jgi:hypothetical protein
MTQLQCPELRAKIVDRERDRGNAFDRAADALAHRIRVSKPPAKKSRRRRWSTIDWP